MRIVLLRFCILLGFLILSGEGHSQKCEWLNTAKGKGFKTVYSTAVDDSNYVISVGEFSDSFEIGTYKFSNPFSSTTSITVTQGILIKCKSNGQMVLGIQTQNANAKSNCSFSDVKADIQGNIYVAGYYRGTVDFGNGLTLKTPTIQYRIVLVKYSRHGITQWVRDIGHTPFQSNYQIKSPKLSIDYKNNIALGFNFEGNIKFDNSFDTLTSKGQYDIGFVKYTASGKFIQALSFGGRSNDKISAMDRDSNGNFFGTGFSSGLNFGSQTLTDSGIFIFKLDSIFTPIIGKVLKGINVSLGISVNDNGKFVLVGQFNDTINFGSLTLTATGTNKWNSFIAYFTSDLKPIWAKKDNPVTSAKVYPVGVSFQDDYIYLGGSSSGQSDTKLGSFVLKGIADNNLFLLKMDTLGNFLWLFSSGVKGSYFGNANSVTTDKNENVIISGQYNKQVTIFDKTDTGYSALSTDSYIAQISKYSIFRGNVYAGPYCAGDTILIPYDKVGVYADSNYFIAELSDEYGNFEGMERELGRIKTNDSGTIQGFLPMLKVNSSGKYRIRVRSTYPQVQSFYKLDSLRLLIFSRDKADPGLSETICKGDSIKLHTYGGTRWTWSPKLKMDDSTFRQPTVWPETTSTYKIIIGDSSGCGDPDTAFKQIIVRPSLKSLFTFNDSFLCKSALLKIPVRFSGGDSTNYKWQWFLVNSPKSFFPLNKGERKISDTLNYNITNSFEKLAVILSDGCTAKSDTSYFVAGLRDSVKIQTILRDTLLCYGILLNYNASATGGVSKSYFWQWSDLTANKIISKKESLTLVTNQTSKIQLVVNDGCDELSDTNEFTIYVNPPLKGSILYNKGSLHDTTLCFGKNLKLYSAGKGGLGSGYNFKWYLDNTLLSSIDTLNFLTTNLYSSTGGSKTLKLVLKDNCTSGSDSISRNIKVIPGPQTNFSWGKTCNKTKIPFTFTGSLAALPVTTKYSWHYPDGDSSTVQNPLKLLSKLGKNQVSLILRSSNGCKDALTKEVDVKQEAIAGFTADDVCEDSAVKFMNTSQDGIDYDWRFGDGGNSNIESPKHLYLISGITKTYNVSLIAIVPNGCSDTITNAVTINANPKSDFNFSSSGTQVNFTAIETSALNYQWIFGDGGTANTTNRNTQYNYSKFPSGKYTACLMVSNLAGCTSETCKEINISGASNSIIKQEGIKIYPNPNKGVFTLEMVEPNGSVTIEIYDPIGKMVYQIESNQSYTLLEPKLDNGIYILRVTNNNQIFTQKILVQK